MCSAVRKINELVKRVRLAKTHGYIISYLKEQMPSFMGHTKKQKEVCNHEKGVGMPMLIYDGGITGYSLGVLSCIDYS